MVDEFQNHSGIRWNGHVGTVQYGPGDAGMVVIFYTRPIHNPAKSAEIGRPFYEDKTYVKIHPPGERLNIVERAATAQDKQRWPMQWAQFEQNKEQTPDGTPVALLYPDHPSIPAMLKAFGVHTIEQCSELSGPAIDNIGMGAQRYCNDAKKYLEMANKGVKGSQLRAELEERDRELHGLRHELELMREELNRMREHSAQNVDLSTIQAMLAGAQGRPMYPPAAGRAPLTKAFDVQSAQIAATHTTTDLAKQKAKPATRRPRQRIQG